MKTRTTLTVQWVPSKIEPVPVVFATGLELLAVDRFLRFARTHKPNYARFSAANDPQRGKPVQVL